MILAFAIIFLVIAFVGLVIIAQIIKLQTTERKQWLAVANYQVATESDIVPMRGNIYDAEGRLLAGSLPKYTLTMDTRVQALHQGGDTLFYQNVDSLAYGLSHIFGDKSQAAYRQMLVSAFRRGDGRLRLQPKAVDYTQMKRVKQLPLYRRGKYVGGLLVEESHQRVKPFGSLASRTIGGIYGETGKGNSGLEKRFDALLAGSVGRSQRQRIAGRYENVVIRPAENGYDVHTTIDANLQDLVESMLRQRIEWIEGEWGCCILMEVETGEIKAISNLDRTESGDYREMQNHAVTRVEPGSTFKTISLMAALDDGKVDFRRDTFHVSREGWKYGDAIIRDAHPLDTVYSVTDAMASSSNIALAKMVTQAYEKKAAKFADKVRKLGALDSLNCEIPGAQQPLIADPKDMTTLAKMSYGYSVEMSPLQILTFYNAIANNGKMVRPMLVKQISRNGHTEKRFKTEVLHSSICSSSTLDEIRQCLHAVVWTPLGTAARGAYGPKAQSRLVPIAGKTGTAQIRTSAGYSSRCHRIAFVGYFPEDNPRYSCICMIHYPHKLGYYDAGVDCGGVVRTIAERTMAFTGTTDAEQLEQPYDSIRKPAIKGGSQYRIHKAAKGTKMHVGRVDSEWARVNGNMEAVAVAVAPGQVPNVIGMGARDAVYAIEQTGMKVQIHGTGRVFRQSVTPGTKAEKGGWVYLELK